jgi:hypothetical protein
MTKKHLFIGLWIIALGITAIVYSVLPKTTQAKKELSDNDVCYGSGSTFEIQVIACWNLIKEADANYQDYSWQLSFINQKIAENSSVKERSRKHIQAITNDFFSKNLSGTNVDFQ